MSSPLTKAIVAALRARKPTSKRLFEGRPVPLVGGQRFSTLPSDSPTRDPSGSQNRRSPRGGGQYSVGLEYD